MYGIYRNAKGVAVRLKARHPLSGFLVHQFGCVEVELSELRVFVHFSTKTKFLPLLVEWIFIVTPFS